MAHIENTDIKIERRRGDTLLNIVTILFGIILSGLTWWMSKIDDKANRVPILEERVMNLQSTIHEIKVGVDKLVNRQGRRD